MEGIVDLIIILLAFILGGGAFYFFRNKKTEKIDLPDAPTKKELNQIKEDKENELLNQNSKTFIDDNLNNATIVNDVKRTSDDAYDRIHNKHRNKRNVDR